MSQSKRFFAQFGLWVFWFLLVCSWALITRREQAPLPLAYNIISLITVFYLARWIAGFYWRKIEKETKMYVSKDGLKIMLPGLKYYIFKWPVFAMVSLVLSYITVSRFVDSLFIAKHMIPGLPEDYTLPDFYYYSYTCWVSVSMYLICGNIMAAIEYHFRKEKERERHLVEENERLYNMTQAYSKELKDVIEYHKQKAEELNVLKNKYRDMLGD
jgi:hypothetical protein